jgi:hypothetical protein
MSSGRLAFIGLGAMGVPTARRLLGAGHEVTVYNRSDAAVERLAATGALRAESARDAVADARVVIAMLPDGPDVEQVAHGPALEYSPACPLGQRGSRPRRSPRRRREGSPPELGSLASASWTLRSPEAPWAHARGR